MLRRSASVCLPLLETLLAPSSPVICLHISREQAWLPPLPTLLHAGPVVSIYNVCFQRLTDVPNKALSQMGNFNLSERNTRTSGAMDSCCICRFKAESGSLSGTVEVTYVSLKSVYSIQDR